MITVAAINEFWERKSSNNRDGENWRGSNFRPEANIIAHGVHVYTTDIMNSGGYNPSGSYTSIFNGTFAATPHVAGVAALILSVNLNLTAKEAEEILKQTTDDISPVGNDDFTGSGRVNAFKAVERVQKILYNNSIEESVEIFV